MDRPSEKTPFHFARPPRPPRPSRPTRPSRPSRPLRPPRLPRPPRPPTSTLPPPPSSSRRRPRAPPYIPPFRQKRLDAIATAQPSTTSTQSGQHRVWVNMKKQINGIINMVSMDNVPYCAKALFRLNLIRANAILVKTLLRAQLASPDLSPVFACLISVIGSRLPQVTELLVARLIAQFKLAYQNQDRSLCFATARFIAHLFNQQVVTDLLLLEFLSTCILNPSDGSIELAVVTLRDCAVLLSEKSPRGLELVFQRLRELLQDGDLSRRVEVMIENLIAMRREKFANANVLDPRLDLLEEADIITHLATLGDEETPDLQYECNNFQYDANFDENDLKYETIKRDILGIEADSPLTPSSLEVPAGPGTGDNVSPQPEAGSMVAASSKLDNNDNGKDKVTDMTEAELVDFRRSVYLTINSGISYEEWAHKLVNLMRKHPGRELELCEMIIESCSQEKTFLRSYGLLGQRFCLLNRLYVSKFEELFATHYATIHRFDTRKIRNIANFYASLFAADSLPWVTFQLVRIVEKETTTSSRIFLKYLFQEIASIMGHSKTKERFAKAASDGHLGGVFPTKDAENVRFSINFFTSIGLGLVTDQLRENLEAIPKTLENQAGGADGDSSSQESSSLSSSSLSSSALSDSSGLEDSMGGSRRDRVRSGSKRGVDDTSLSRSERPVKTRRGNANGDGDDAERRVISGRWSPHNRSVGRGGNTREQGGHGRSDYDRGLVERKHIRHGDREEVRSEDRDNRDVSRERRSPRDDGRRRRKERAYRYRRRRSDDCDDSDGEGDYGADRRRERHERREVSKSERGRRRRSSRERSSRRRSMSRSRSVSDDGRDEGRRYGRTRRDDGKDSDGKRYYERGGGPRRERGGFGGGSSGRRDVSGESSDDRLCIRSGSPRRYVDSDYDDDGYTRRRRSVSRV